MLRKTLSIIACLAMGSSLVPADINRTQGSLAQKKFSSIDRYTMLVYARSGKMSYSVNEPMGIELKLKEDAYIYFWAINRDGHTNLILPNDFESYNMYKKNIAYTVPESSARYNFIPVGVGVEELYVLASPKKLSKDDMKKIIKKEVSLLKSKKMDIKKDAKKCGIVVMQKKPQYDLVHLKIIINGHKESPESNVKITASPYGSSDGHYPKDKK